MLSTTVAQLCPSGSFYIRILN